MVTFGVFIPPVLSVVGMPSWSRAPHHAATCTLATRWLIARATARWAAELNGRTARGVCSDRRVARLGCRHHRRRPVRYIDGPAPAGRSPGRPHRRAREGALPPREDLRRG